MGQIKYFVCCIFFLVAGATSAFASGIAPFSTVNQSPLFAIYGLPAVGEAAILAKQGGSWQLALDMANNYLAEKNASETLILDGESYRVTLSGRYGIGRKMELGLDIPFVIAGGGFLDNLIENYHATFGFPNGGREYAPQNRLLYRYQKNGVTLLNMEQSGGGLGDMAISGGRQICQSKNGHRQLALRARLKLPTGDADALRGSGGTDLAFWAVGNLDRQFSPGQVSLFGAVGALGLSKGKVLTEQQNSLVGFGSLGVGFRPADWIELKVQTNAHTAFYKDSDFREISGASAQLIMGGSLHFNSQTSLDIGVAEDIIVGASPDVALHLLLKRAF